MTFFRKNLGKKGEKSALDYLKNNGYKILGQNLRYKFGEIDILAQDEEDIVLVEVKTKSGDEFGEPSEEVDYFKRKKLWQLARFINQKYPSKNIRIDVISIKMNENPELEHIKNAVLEE